MSHPHLNPPSQGREYWKNLPLEGGGNARKVGANPAFLEEKFSDIIFR